MGLIGTRPEPVWGPTGKEVYERTYSREKADGSRESWIETVTRVVDGNLSLVDPRFVEAGEREALIDSIYNFRIIPAGRHLWMSGVEGRQFLFNCYVAGWGNHLHEHFAFTFNQLMQGGGVGSNYSAKYVNPKKYPIYNLVNVEIVCSEEHENYGDLFEAGLVNDDIKVGGPLNYILVPDSREGWVDALSSIIGAATTPKEGEPLITIVVDVSHIRAAGEPIKTFGGTSAGPAPLARLLKNAATVLADAWEVEDGMSGPHAMLLDHEIANCVVSGNVRRSARMSIMHWNDPEIDWFLNCKKDGRSHWSTNISVEIDDEFISLVSDVYAKTGKDEFKVSSSAHEKARRVYEAIIKGMLTNGEPGIWNSSLANVGEPNPVIATNPCGEICLEEWENCNLGHVNLDAFVNRDGSVDYKGLLKAHRLMTRFLMRATFGDITYDKTRQVVDRNRRIGVGHFGFAGFLAKRGIPFSESWRCGVIDRRGDEVDVWDELRHMYREVRSAAQSYAHKLRIPMPVKLTTVAPTGTIAKMPGRTEGIHPVYARYFIRRIRYSMVDPAQEAKVDEYRRMGYNVVEDVYAPNTWVVEIPTKEALVQELEDLGIPGYYLESVDEISLENMLNVQQMYQTAWADNAVSFTVNIPKGKYNVEEVAAALLPKLPYLKGTTLMVDDSRELAPYERISKVEYMNLVGDNYEILDDSYDENCASGACPVR